MNKLMEYKKEIEELNCLKCLRLEHLNDDDVQSLVEVLKGSQVKTLYFASDFITCNGLKCLFEVLKDTEITELYLRSNTIGDEDVKYLAESVKYTKIRDLDLRDNSVGIDAAEYLIEMLRNIECNSLYLDVYFKENGHAYKFISQTFCNGMKNVNIMLHGFKIGINEAQYIQKTCKNTKISSLTVDWLIDENNTEIFAQIFQNVQIKHLAVERFVFLTTENVKRLIRVFEASYIGCLSCTHADLTGDTVKHLTEFLKCVKVMQLDISGNDLGDVGMKYIASALQNSDIMYINLSNNFITAKRIKYLAEVLPFSKIVYLNLSCNRIQADGVKQLAESLPFSQITGVNLNDNGIEYRGYQYLENVVNQTNLSVLNLCSNDKSHEEQEGENLYYYSENSVIPRKTISIAAKICNAFQELISLNTFSNEFEFITSKAITNFSIDIDQYIFLLNILKESPNAKVHIIVMMCDGGYGNFNLDIMAKIENFIAVITNKFIIFFEGKLPDLIETFEVYDFVELVGKFENMKLCDVVQSLLLHRVLFYVDENQEILHPYIYKLLHKYNMPLYNEQLEPNKKEKIISYYQNHQEIEGVQEMIDLLKSISF